MKPKRRRGMPGIIWLIVLLALAGLAFIRFAPSDTARWHIDPLVTANQDLVDGVRRRVPGDAEALAQLHAIILETPRTEVLAGSPAQGHVTYVTRSLWFGFPDYTTVLLEDGRIGVWARLRFGKSDMGVNRARVDAWLAELAARMGS